MKNDMTPKQVRRKFASIQSKRTKWNEQLFELQQICSHPNVMKEHKSNTGNYDPSADSYWIEYRCLDCHKHWRVEQ